MELVQHDVDMDGIRIRSWETGKGEPLLLVHGTGPGAGSRGYWRKMLEPLAQDFRVIAYDLIGFGESARKPQPPYFDSALWQRQARFMLEQFGGAPANVMAHSLSGATILALAAERLPTIKKVMTTGTLGASLPISQDAIQAWTFPADEQALRSTAEMLVYDAGLIDDQYIQGRMKTLFSGDYGSYFAEMFQGDQQRFIDEVALSDEQLANIDCEVLMVHGRNDRPASFQSSMELAEKIKRADLFILDRCGHSVAFEHPEKLLWLARGFFLQR